MATLILTANDPVWNIPSSQVTHRVFGSSGIDQITLETGAKAELSSFRNGDVLSLQGNTSDFQIYNSGSTVTLQDSSGTHVSVAAGLNPVTVNFSDQSATLLIDPAQGIIIGSQVVTTTPTVVTLEGGKLPSPVTDDHGNTLDTATLITANGATGVIEEAYDSDWFKIDLSANKSYTFDLLGSGTNAVTDTTLALYDASGNQIAFNDDANGSLYSQITNFAPASDGYYYLEAQAYSSRTGSYELNVSATDVSIPTPEPSDGFNYTLNYTNSSAFGSYYNQVDAGIQAALNYWGQFLNDAPGANIEIEISYEPQSGSTLASAGAWNYYSGGSYPTFNGLPVAAHSVQYELQNGQDYDSTWLDAGIRIATSDLSVWWFDPTPYDRSDNTPGSDQFDFIGVMLHEFGHALGISSTYEYSSYAGFGHSKPYYTLYDTFISWNSSQTEFYFTGTNANNVYSSNGGSGTLPLFVEPDRAGSSFSHYDGYNNNGGIHAGMLMNPSVSRGVTLDISAIDLAILQDLGYSVNYNQLSNNAAQAGNSIDALTAIGIPEGDQFGLI